jgi:putative DNA primase/helicase
MTRFEAFLDEAMDGDREKIDFLQRAAGYTLSGDMREQVFLFLHGPEAAGKGTFIRALADVMGNYAQSTEISTFLTARRDAVRNDIASLVGARLVTASEPEDGQTFDEGLIKILTGQDKTKARFLFRESFEFSATFKLWLQGNHRPHIRSTGGAMWRRLLIVPFTNTVPEERRDKTLGDRLRTPEERAGILAWMVRGCLEWQRAGLRPPESIRAAVSEYRAAEDRLAPFLEEKTGASKAGQVPKGKLYSAYKAWAEDAGERPMSKRALGTRMEERGFAPNDKAGGVRVWNGLFLVDRGDE